MAQVEAVSRALVASVAHLAEDLVGGSRERELQTKELVRQAWQQISTTEQAVSATDDVLKSALELSGKELVWNAAYAEPSGENERDWQIYDQKLYVSLDVVLELYEQASDTSNQRVIPVDPGAMLLPLIEDMIDLTSSRSWHTVLNFLDDRRARLTANMQPNKGKALTLLRTLNNLLRSLSRSTSQPSSSSISELKLRGKVHLFMANVYGISDPSGTNARGDFAPLSRSRAALRKVEGDIEMQSTEEQDPARQPESTRTIFEAITSLLEYFSQPTLLVDNNAEGKAHSMADFKAKADLVLQRLFEETSQNSLANQTADGLQAASYQQLHLESIDLLPFQLSSLAFRKQLLVQFLLFLQMLQQLHRDEKTKHPRIMVFPASFSLTPEDVQWARAKFADIRDDFVKMGADGEQFDGFLRRVVTHDRHHAIWKASGAYTFEQQPQDDSWIEGVERSARINLLSVARPYEWSSGTQALTEMDRDPLRSVDQLQNYDMNLNLATLNQAYVDLEKSQAEVSEGQGPDDNSRLGLVVENKASLSWRALRLTMTSNLAAFEHVPKGDLPKLYSVLTGSETQSDSKVPEKAAVTSETEPTSNGQDDDAMKVDSEKPGADNADETA